MLSCSDRHVRALLLFAGLIVLCCTISAVLEVDARGHVVACRVFCVEPGTRMIFVKMKAASRANEFEVESLDFTSYSTSTARAWDTSARLEVI